MSRISVRRIIPARAGPTLSRWGSSATWWDHPRLRGADGAGGMCVEVGEGSSPLARGRHSEPSTEVEGLRIIPACAGPTTQVARERDGQRDHPRLRGADPARSSDSTTSAGSSPLARGRRCCPTRGRRPAGIIPACAGPTARVAPGYLTQEDHPRLRGADNTLEKSAAQLTGSSPLARGRRRLAAARRSARRIIPACAGPTSLSLLTAVTYRDHPRLRGADRAWSQTWRPA